MDKIKLADGEFGILNNGKIEIDSDTMDIWFEKGKDSQGREVVVMHLTTSFKYDPKNIAIGETETTFSKLGALIFVDPTYLDGIFKNFRLFIDPNDKNAVRMRSSNLDFDIKTNGKKRENGDTFLLAKEQQEREIAERESQRNE